MRLNHEQRSGLSAARNSQEMETAHVVERDVRNRVGSTRKRRARHARKFCSPDIWRIEQDTEQRAGIDGGPIGESRGGSNLG